MKHCVCRWGNYSSFASRSPRMSKSGWVQKQGGSVQNWKMRWMVLEPEEHVLAYFKTQVNPSPRSCPSPIPSRLSLFLHSLPYCSCCPLNSSIFSILFLWTLRPPSPPHPFPAVPHRLSSEKNRPARGLNGLFQPTYRSITSSIPYFMQFGLKIQE